MTRLLAAVLLASTIEVTLGACGENSADSGYAYGGSGVSSSMCSAQTTCASCTPVLGCGWCFSGGAGSCAPDPDSCSDASEFTWTWNPSGCPVEPTVGPVDAGTITPAEAMAPLDARSETASD